ncbi:MAG: RluA family pseudouridine synthase [Clostridiales Family XIII bacterium]|jgi:23S rRNA pseudouridine1911/1915/1917 synthase|nr:RluA family pseudouridine synthase [Clostridiales Family XIII bacterium]
MKYDLEYTVKDSDAGMTARGVASRRLGVSRRLIRRIANAAVDYGGEASFGGVFIGGRPARFTDRVKPGDVVGLAFPDEASGFVPQDIPIDVIREDDDILALNKQPGLVVHPTKGHVDGTIANGLMRRMEGRGERYKIRFANRLDMGTSGVLLIGKNSHAQSEFARQSGAGRIRKLYLAVLCGVPPESAGVVDAPIALEEEGAPRRTVREGGAPSRTFYRILESYEYSLARPSDGIGGAERHTGDGVRRASLALISITTGRTHQIRVHMSHIGCPVMGDTLYGGGAPMALPDGVGEPVPIIGRQALHAAILRFAHPRTREEITLAAPLPADMIACLRALGAKAVGA